MNTKILGTTGEEIATNYLKKSGYKILARNYSNQIGEIDIIAKEKGTIVFVEIKARSSLAFGFPREAVGSVKQERIRKIATSYLKETKNIGLPCRFDVVEILGEKLTHIKNAF